MQPNRSHLTPAAVPASLFSYDRTPQATDQGIAEDAADGNTITIIITANHTKLRIQLLDTHASETVKGHKYPGRTDVPEVNLARHRLVEKVFRVEVHGVDRQR